MATKVIYGYEQEKPMDIRDKFVSLFEKLSDDSEAVKSLGRLFSLLFGEPFISPLFKGNDYEWENEWRIVRSSWGLPVDTNGSSYYQLDKKNIVRVLISSEMNTARAKEIIEMCKKNELPYEIHPI